MAPLVIVNAFAYAHGYDFTGDSNELQMKMELEDKDATTFRNNGWRTRAGGLKNSELAIAGLWSAAPDAEAFGDLGVMSRAVTFGPAETETGAAYLSKQGKFKYDRLGSIGDVAPFKLECRGSDMSGVPRGQLAKAMGSVNATGALGSVLNLGAVSATQYVYATVHCFVAGTTMTVQVQSDDDPGFATPTTVATFTAITAAGGSWLTPVIGPNTDTYWRLRISAITGTFICAGAIAIQ